MAFGSDLSELPQAPRAMVERELEPGEQVLWSGTSDRKLLRTKRWQGTIVGAAVIAVFCIIPALCFRFTPVSQDKARPAGERIAVVDTRLLVSNILFGLAGGSLMLGFIGAVSEPGGPARVPAMVITPRRIIILKPRGWRTAAVTSFAPEDLKGLHRTENAAGHGSLWLRGTAGFELELIEWIRDVREVERLIRRTFALGNGHDVQREDDA